MRCRLLLPMCTVSVCLSVCPSVCHVAAFGGMCSVYGSFSAAFAKLVWPLVTVVSYNTGLTPGIVGRVHKGFPVNSSARVI